MPKFSYKDPVIQIQTGLAGYIIEVFPSQRGRQMYRIQWENNTQTDEFEAYIRPDCNLSDPFERWKNGIFGSYVEYVRKNTTFKIQNTNNSTISSLKASKTMFHPYQFKPLLKFLNSDNRRLLIADEVGLGKTIEAGHIMSELKARKELHNVLIVCPSSLREKWRDELSEKFGFSFKIYEDSDDLIRDLQYNDGAVCAIVNYERMRAAKTERKNKNSDKKTEPSKNKTLIDRIHSIDAQFSLLLCDEAHRMRNQETLLYKGMSSLMPRAKAVLFLTATPVMISEENLFNLLHLLDAERFDNWQIFRNMSSGNKPIIKALAELNSSNFSFGQILKHLQEANITTTYSVMNKDKEEIIREQTVPLMEKYKQDPVFQEIVQLLSGEDSLQNRALLQSRLSAMNVLNTTFSRTRKKEVTTDMSQARREPHKCLVQWTPEERNLYNTLREDIQEEQQLAAHSDAAAALAITNGRRQLASSIFAFNRGHALPPKDSKLEKLKEIIQAVFADKRGKQRKIIVFAVYQNTLTYLETQLQADGFCTFRIDGGTPKEKRQGILKAFEANEEASVLVSSEVGSEGLDMQFCDSIVNYDLPWNPMVVEQRIGRIDRIGQESEVINIYNFVVEGSIQEDIFMRLLERIGIFRETIGDMEAILDAPFEGGISIRGAYEQFGKDLYVQKLTDEQLKEKGAQIAQAIENERQTISELESNVTNMLTNDAYFQNEIKRIISQKAYITDMEMRNYLQAILQTKETNLTTFDLVSTTNETFNLIVPPRQSGALDTFLNRYEPDTSDNRQLVRQFLNRVRGEESIHLTFNQEMAYQTPNLEFLNMYHPLIQACFGYNQGRVDKAQTTFQYALPHSPRISKGGLYCLALYELTIKNLVLGEEQSKKTLVPIVYDLVNQKTVEDSELIDELYGRTQTDGVEYNFTNEDLRQEALMDLRYCLTEAIKNVVMKQTEEMQKIFESSRLRKAQQVKDFYESRIDRLQKQIDGQEERLQEKEDELQFHYYSAQEKKDIEKEIRQIEGGLNLLQSNLNNLQQEYEKQLHVNQDPQIRIQEELVSLNLINII